MSPNLGYNKEKKIAFAKLLKESDYRKEFIIEILILIKKEQPIMRNP